MIYEEKNRLRHLWLCGVHAAEHDAGVGRCGAQAQRNFFAAVQADARHADGAFQGALLNHGCLGRKNHGAILSQPDFSLCFSPRPSDFNPSVNHALLASPP